MTETEIERLRAENAELKSHNIRLETQVQDAENLKAEIVRLLRCFLNDITELFDEGE